MVSDERAVNAAVEAAESVIFSRYDRSELDDLDIAVNFEAGTLEVDVYVNAPAAEDAGTVADEAALAARDAVDDLLEG
jgi:hypothetical protein